MRKTAYTPAPWFPNEWPRPHLDGDFLRVGIFHATPTLHAGEHVWVNALAENPVATATARANVSLICAAPVMLETLARIQRIAAGIPDAELRGQIVGLARPVIEQARGQVQPVCPVGGAR